MQRFDLPGAVLVTGGLSSLVYAITQAGQRRLAGRRRRSTVFAASLALLAGFVAWELRHPEPLMRFGILQTRTVSGANVAGFILGTAMFSMFLMLTLYMQQVLGYSPMKTGVAYLAVAGTAIVWSGRRGQLVTRIGVKPVLVIGMAMLTAGLLYFTQVSVDGGYVRDLLPGFLVIGVGIGFSFVPISIAALAGVQAGRGRAGVRADQHLAADRRRARASRPSRRSRRPGRRTPSPRARSCPRRWSTGSPSAFLVGAVFAAVGIVAALTLIRRDELEAETESLGALEGEPLLDAA